MAARIKSKAKVVNKRQFNFVKYKYTCLLSFPCANHSRFLNHLKSNICKKDLFGKLHVNNELNDSTLVLTEPSI